MVSYEYTFYEYPFSAKIEDRERYESESYRPLEDTFCRLSRHHRGRGELDARRKLATVTFGNGPPSWQQPLIRSYWQLTSRHPLGYLSIAYQPG